MTADKRILAAGAAIIIAATFTEPGEAQTLRSALQSADAARGNFARDRNVAVRQRQREGYEAVGVRMGAFMAWPKLTLGATHNDNIYGASTNTVDDLIWQVQPEVSVTSNWSRHALSGYARASVNRYQDFDSEDTEDYGVGGDFRLDVLRSAKITGGLSWAQLTEPRTSAASPTASASPIQYEQTALYFAAGREFNRLKVSGRYDFREFDYEDGVTTGGANIEQDDRDRKVQALTGRADYAVSPATALFIETTYNWREYGLVPPTTTYTRDSKGASVLVGANFEIGPILRGEIGVGYLQQEYDDAAFNDIDGFGARGQVEWFPTQLTTVTLTGSRTVEDSGIVGSSGYLANNIGAQIDHELMRNVILTAQAGYAKDEYEGIDRKDERLSAGVSATYLLNRHAGLTLAYSYLDQDSSGLNSGNNFEVNKVGASLTLQF